MLSVIALLFLLGYGIIKTLKLDYFNWDTFQVQLIYSRICLVSILTILIYYFFRYYKTIDFSNHGNSENLAIFRILYFGFFAIGSLFRLDTIIQETVIFSQMEEGLLTDVPFFNWIPKIIPFNKSLAIVACITLSISSVFSMIGIKTRWSIFIFIIATLYIFGIPNFFGKINHNHHIIWIAVVLFCAPCYDRFSVDSYLKVKSSHLIINRKSETYQLFFTLLWAVIGIIYFFPGFWKIWGSGLDWAFTDNLQNQMNYKWTQLNGWKPFINIESMPSFIKLGGLFVIIFEILFLPFVLMKQTRNIAVFSGVIFHISTLLFMNIFFVVLLLCYLSFIPWHKWLFKSKTKLDIIIKHGYSKVNFAIPLLLLFINFCFGIAKCNSFPFTVYPTFDHLMKGNFSYPIVYIGVLNNDSQIELPRSLLIDTYRSERLWELERQFLETHTNRDPFLDEVFKTYKITYPDLKRIILFKGNKSLDYNVNDVIEKYEYY